MYEGSKIRGKNREREKKTSEVTLVSPSLTPEDDKPLVAAKCLHENNEHFAENTLEALRGKASELSDNTLTPKQALVCSGPLSL